MTKYRSNLPQTGDKYFVTDAGLETVLMFHDGIDLPGMAAYPLLARPEGVERLRTYYREFLMLAREHRIGCLLESATWRANPEWAAATGYSLEDLAEANREAIALLVDLRNELETEQSPAVISGCVGPRGDGYVPSKLMTANEAEDYHSWQISVLRETEADMISAFTINYLEEALGVTKAAMAAGMPFVMSFTIETDGRLPTGQTQEEAINAVDEETSGYPAYYMINCAHPTHFEHALAKGEPWVERIRGLRPNSSSKSHAELDECETLDEGNPTELGQQHLGLADRLPNLRVVGGCCGTDIRHVREICKTLSHRF